MTGAWAGAQVAAVTSEFCGPFAPLCAAGTILAAGVGGWFAGSSPETPLAKVPENFATSCIDVDAFEAARGRK